MKNTKVQKGKEKEFKNQYKLVRSSTFGGYDDLSNDANLQRLFSLGEQVRKAFNGLTDNLYDHIEISVPDKGRYGINFSICGNSFISLVDGAFDFLSKSHFTYRVEDKEPWELQIDEIDDGFGAGMSVSAQTPRECVLAMIRERQKDLTKTLKSLNKFKRFENYTRHLHAEC